MNKKKGEGENFKLCKIKFKVKNHHNDKEGRKNRTKIKQRDKMISSRYTGNNTILNTVKQQLTNHGDTYVNIC